MHGYQQPGAGLALQLSLLPAWAANSLVQADHLTIACRPDAALQCWQQGSGHLLAGHALRYSRPAWCCEPSNAMNRTLWTQRDQGAAPYSGWRSGQGARAKGQLVESMQPCPHHLQHGQQFSVHTGDGACGPAEEHLMGSLGSFQLLPSSISFTRCILVGGCGVSGRAALLCCLLSLVPGLQQCRHWA